MSKVFVNRTVKMAALAAVMAVPLAGAFAHPAAAQHWDRGRGGWHGDRGYGNRGNGGAIIGGALLGLGVGAVIGGVLAPPPPVYYAPPPVYYAPPPVYYAPPPPVYYRY